MPKRMTRRFGYTNNVLIVDIGLNAISRSRNLRGILDYSRRNPVERIDLYGQPLGAGLLGITWINGSSVITEFASFSVMREWTRDRAVFHSITPTEHH